MAEPQIIYEESDFVVINKPAGLIVHHAAVAGVESREPSLADWVVEKYPETKTVGDPSTSSGQVVFDRPGIVHRLDKDTSGVMIIARTQEAFSFFKNLFQTKLIRKTYLALVYGAPKELKGVIDKPIGLNSGSVKRTVFVKNAKMVKEAVTEYEVERSFEIGGVPVSLVRVFPQTGRTHQIRVHMASIGCPIVGDALYGSKKETVPLARQFLHADSIEFPTSRGNRLTISADLPADLAALIPGRS